MSAGVFADSDSLGRFRSRRIVLPDDRQSVLDFHCQLIYESDVPWARRLSYDEYRRRWLSTPQPDKFLSSIAGSLADERTIAHLWFEKAQAMAYMWVTFGEFGGYGICFAEVNEICVAPGWRRKGVGWALLNVAEESARRHGASVLRWSAGVENLAAIGLVRKGGFEPVQVLYEKLLVEDPLHVSRP